MKKIIQINVVYKKGSTGDIVYNLHRGLEKKKERSLVIYGRGIKENEKNIFKPSSEIIMKLQSLYSKISGNPLGGAFFSTNKVIKILKKENPDIVHLHCLNGYFINVFKLLNFLKINKIKTILTLHAEFMYTGGCGNTQDCSKWEKECNECPQFKKGYPSYFKDESYKNFKRLEKCFKGFNENLIIVPVSKWLFNQVKRSPILKEKNIKVINNGIDTENIYFPTIDENLRLKYNLSGKKVILHVTPNFSNPLKGGEYVIKLAKRLEKQTNIVILIIGKVKVTEKFPSNVILIGIIYDKKELAKFYSIANLTLLTSKSETFSMICAESISCGTPIIGFKAGAPELISLKEYSCFVEYGNLNALEEKIKENLNLKSNLKTEDKEKAKQFYSIEKMIEGYCEIYKEILGERT